MCIRDRLLYDDGNSNLLSSFGASGSINYETGAFRINNAPSRADFVFSVAYGSAHAGGNEFSAATGNSLLEIGARSCNSKINTTIEIIGLH